MQSDLMQPDFLATAYGYKMNGCGVGDIVYPGKYRTHPWRVSYKKLKLKSKTVDIKLKSQRP